MEFCHTHDIVFCGVHRPPDERPRVEGFIHNILTIQALKIKQNKKISFRSIRVGPTIDGTFSEWPHRSAALTLETIAASSDPGCRRGDGGGVTGHTYSDML